MRIWDVSPGYLSRASLLGEHRELHAVHVVVAERRTGYSRHPETLRWKTALTGLAGRHAALAAEMNLRGYVDRTPLPKARVIAWPSTFVTEPAQQIELLRRKYAGAHRGRIPLPRTAHELWAQHKYSVMARDPSAYRGFGRTVARMRRGAAVDALARDLVVALREPPSEGRLVNALEHMWGHVRGGARADEKRAAADRPQALLSLIQILAERQREMFLLSSTALSELAVFADGLR